MEKVTVDVLIESKEQDSAKQDFKDEIDVKALDDTELRKQLCIYGICPGPILPSTRTTYEKKLMQLMQQCPTVAAEEKSRLDDSELENDGGKGQTTEVVLQTNNLKVTAECASGLDNKSAIDVVERQKKLLSPDVEHSLARIVAELQEILPEGKVALQRSQGLRRKAAGSPESNCRKKRSDSPHIDYGYPDANSVGQSTRRKTVREDCPVKQSPEIKCQVAPVNQREGRIPTRVKIAVFAIFLFLLFVFVTMETNLENPFASFIMGK
ncbi:LEM domain-containing protein 1 [Elgaria multicarinata webbii]|uniref:LEM domain-containing protein 1 n=1 Tax=Elgaria multicarinata webbii TaxID=159646 RepID=UPI002FCD475D